MLTGDLNICDLEEGRLCGTRQTLTNGDMTNQRVQGCLPKHPGVGSTRLHPEGRRPWPHENSLSLSYRQGVHQHSSVGTGGHPIFCQRLLSDPITMRLYIEQLVRKIGCTGLSPLGLAGIHLQFELGGPTRCPTGTTLIVSELWSNSR